MGGMSDPEAVLIAQVFGEDAVEWTDPDGAPWNGMFVKSQFQLAFDTAGATGRKLKVAEAMEAYREEALHTVADRGRFVLPANAGQPAEDLRRRRELLGLSVGEVASAAGMTPAAVTAAETPGQVNLVRNLEAIAQHLGLG